MASEQGGVCPVVEQGSNVTNISDLASADSAFGPKFLKTSWMAFTSACPSPAVLCHPLPIISLSRVITHHTIGFGLVVKSPFLARDRASCICSEGEVIINRLLASQLLQKIH